MSEDLENELEAIRSIYGDDALRRTGDNGVYVLSLPHYEASLRLFFPLDYPESSPQILGTEKTGEHTRKGYGRGVVDISNKILQRVYVPGSVCLFDLLQELDASLADTRADRESPDATENEEAINQTIAPPPLHADLAEEPHWILSSPITEKKSAFLARACTVTSPAQAQACVAHLLANDKRAAKATHNVIAYRIRSQSAVTSMSEVTYQDCDDDGETAAGGRLLHLLQVMEVWGVLVVVSRWYGGVKLGPDRFSIINKVAREVIIEGGWARSRIVKH